MKPVFVSTSNIPGKKEKKIMFEAKYGKSGIENWKSGHIS